MSSLRPFPEPIKYALVITVDKYDDLRNSGFPGFHDIEETKADRAINLEHLPHLGFDADKIIDMNNPTRD